MVGTSQLQPTTLLSAAGNGTTDDTAAFVSALAGAKHVLVPYAPGGYAITGLSIPQGVTLELLPGAILKTSGPILLNENGSRFLGWTAGISGVMADASDATPNIFWTGAENGVAVHVGQAISSSASHSAPVGNIVSGLSVHGGGIAGVTGIRIGNPSVGWSWGLLSQFFATQCAVGVHVKAGAQQTRFQHVHVRNCSGKGIYVEGVAGTGTTSLWFDNFTVETTPEGVVCGGATGQGGSGIHFQNGVVEGCSASAFTLAAGGPYLISQCHVEQAGANAPSVILGRAGDFAFFATIRNSYLGGGGGTIFRGFGWRHLLIEGNVLVGNNLTSFENVGGGSSRYGGRWINNHSDLTGTSTEITDATGFDHIFYENKPADNQVPRPRWHIRGNVEALRFKGLAGTPLTAADLGPGEFTVVFDPTNGAAKLLVLGRTLDGTLVSGGSALVAVP